MKVTDLGGKVVTLSGPDGYIYDPAGISGEKIDYMLELRNSGNDIVAPYADEFPGSTFYPGKKPWEQKVDIALPCATQNELTEAAAEGSVTVPIEARWDRKHACWTYYEADHDENEECPICASEFPCVQEVSVYPGPGKVLVVHEPMVARIEVGGMEKLN